LCFFFVFGVLGFFWGLVGCWFGVSYGGDFGFGGVLDDLYFVLLIKERAPREKRKTTVVVETKGKRLKLVRARDEVTLGKRKQREKEASQGAVRPKRKKSLLREKNQEL